MTRRYRGIVCGVAKEDEGIVEGASRLEPHPTAAVRRWQSNQEHGKPAITHYKVLQKIRKIHLYGGFSWRPDGAHQIRVHMASYSGIRFWVMDLLWKSEKPGNERVAGTDFVMPWSLDLYSPSTHEYMESEAPLPEISQNLLLKLSKQS